MKDSEAVYTNSLPLPDAEVFYVPQFLSEKEADTYFQFLLKETQWQEDSIRIFGKTYLQPRKTALFGEEGKTYSYSGITMAPKPFTPALRELKKMIEPVANARFNTVLLNLYRNGNDSNGWHSDDEKELGPDPVIASLSLGAPRLFHFRKKGSTALTHRLELQPGSLLVMGPGTQRHYAHQLPKTKRPVNARINLTFRQIVG
ncbi:MAG: alpha-ketoglutarate-dependent dioxygenase AlkB [Flavobacteriaceae bacterium]|nr:alpha-ketoglutarate-dependent dioxygenase AlkB [Flavobacteriaceae bacterium]